MEIAEKDHPLTEDEQVLLYSVLHEDTVTRIWLRWGPLHILICFLLVVACIAVIPALNGIKNPTFFPFLIGWAMFGLSVWDRERRFRKLVRKLHQESQPKQSGAEIKGIEHRLEKEVAS